MRTLFMHKTYQNQRAPWWRVLSGIGLTFIAVVAGIIAGGASFFLSALGTDQIWLLLVSGALSLAIVTYGLGWFAAYVARVRQARRFGLGLMASTLVVVSGLSGATILRPAMVEPVVLPPPPAGTAFWDLPTGSRIAYRVFPAEGRAAATPIIFLHGGPGTVVEAYTPPISGLARHGYDVYLYDQAGSGYSSRLNDVRGYTVARNVADLEAIRSQIGAEQIILVGQSWGGTLAAQYLAAYPERVARAILTSPGVMDAVAWGDQPMGAITDRVSPEQFEQFSAIYLSPRMYAVRFLTAINPAAAARFAPEAELDAVFRAAGAVIAQGGVCDPAAAPDFNGMIWSFWANSMISNDMQAGAGDTPARLARVQTPVLIMRGECDYVRWEVTRQYREVLPNATLVYLDGAGHQIAIEQPEAFDALAGAFLRGEALPAYDGMADPSK